MGLDYNTKYSQYRNICFVTELNDLILFTCSPILEYLTTKFNNQEIKYAYIKSDSIYNI